MSGNALSVLDKLTVEPKRRISDDRVVWLSDVEEVPALLPLSVQVRADHLESPFQQDFLDHPRFAALQASLDALWIDDRDHVLADMNGSAVFLFLVLKNKLKLAVRRQLARERGLPAPSGGPLDPGEIEACEDAYATLHEALDLPDHAVAAARALSSRHDAELAAPRLLAWLREVGAPRLADRSPGPSAPV